MVDLDTIKLDTETWRAWCVRVAKLHGLDRDAELEYLWLHFEGYSDELVARHALCFGYLTMSTFKVAARKKLKAGRKGAWLNVYPKQQCYWASFWRTLS